ncbi:unnamed protein product [Toxocara canis]|uniref:DNA-directed RNA polymerase n=1 Tax=Toxocara canis TaxID=6265 RepID=A0A183UI56_TOXCA|nr:unnamed protein product [Toxocara canis]
MLSTEITGLNPGRERFTHYKSVIFTLEANLRGHADEKPDGKVDEQKVDELGMRSNYIQPSLPLHHCGLKDKISIKLRC